MQNPEAGGWTIEVVGFNVPDGPQPFSLIVSPFLVNCSDAGSLRMNSDLYSCSDVIDLRVVDCGLNTSDMVVDTVTVNVASDTVPAGIAVLLTETAAESGAFTGMVMIADDGTGDLLVSAGDTITATYDDADTGEGSPATVQVTADVDCTPPVISNVMASDVQPRSATITFDTDEAASATVRWGTTCGVWDDEVSVSTLNSSHSVEITGLIDNTAYFFEVEAVDGAGNLAFDDNSGTCYTFMTPEIPDFFTQQFTTETDLDGTRIEFTPNGTAEFYTPCSEPIFSLPVPTVGGTDLGLGDDTPTEVALTDGAEVSLYGVSYSSVFVGPNGYITLGAGDSDFTETLGEHFDTPRVAVAYDDLHPGQGGAVIWQQLSDRAVITWDAVRERGATDEVTAQIELFFDGRIALSWIESSGVDCIAGLSAGNGLDPDFFQSDLSSYASCGPRPPFAGFASASVAANDSVEFDLTGTDDGIPGGPLTFSVTALPANGVLADAAGGLITSVPYELAAGDTTLRYAPAPGYQGTDTVLFTVNDGGMAPDGGDSLNTGTVTLTVGGPQRRLRVPHG